MQTRPPAVCQRHTAEGPKAGWDLFMGGRAGAGDLLRSHEGPGPERDESQGASDRCSDHLERSPPRRAGCHASLSNPPPCGPAEAGPRRGRERRKYMSKVQRVLYLIVFLPIFTGFSNPTETHHFQMRAPKMKSNGLFQRPRGAPMKVGPTKWLG
jgi:hypothetical protein